MQCWLYRLRDAGVRRAANDPAMRHGIPGWLEFGRSIRHRSRGPSWEAHLRSGRGGQDLVMPLYNSRLAHADGVLHIVGYEDHGRQNTKASPVYLQQSWLVAFDPLDALLYLDRIHARAPMDIEAEDEALDRMTQRLMNEDPAPPERRVRLER